MGHPAGRGSAHHDNGTVGAGEPADLDPAAHPSARAGGRDRRRGVVLLRPNNRQRHLGLGAQPFQHALPRGYLPRRVRGLRGARRREALGLGASRHADGPAVHVGRSRRVARLCRPLQMGAARHMGVVRDLHLSPGLRGLFPLAVSRDAPRGSHAPATLRLVLIGAAVPLAGYGLGLLAAPGTFTGFWPWPIDGFMDASTAPSSSHLRWPPRFCGAPPRRSNSRCSG